LSHSTSPQNHDTCLITDFVYVCVCVRETLGFELRANTLSHFTSPFFFVMGFFFCELFARVGFKPQSS
jgi:hypothetical protein